ncbi:PepSY domain-containing protein [Pseudomonas sp. NPDC090202]|uniref:PepSY domain-containing protein n=1 Tax=unclassified Pseudomonas TaxID=196821 RepID=UPI00381D4F08
MIANKRPGERIAPGVIAACILLACAAAQARDLNQDEALELRRQGVILPLEQLITQALGRYPGSKLLEAELEEKHDVLVYEIELLTADQVVRELKFDARDSRLLQDKEDD